MREHLEACVPEVIEQVKTAALAGDIQACGLVLKYSLPVQRATSPTVEFELDADAPLHEQAVAVLKAVADGKVPADIGNVIIGTMSQVAGIKHVTDVLLRVEEMERMFKMRLS